MSVYLSEEKMYGNIYQKYIQTTRKYDAYWYEKIANNGYPKVTDKKELGYANEKDFKQSEWAFFPFYPKLISGMKTVFGMNYNSAAFFLSLLFSFLSLVGMLWFSLIFLKNESKALFTTLLFFCFPFSFYFSMFYTEALFFTFLLFSFIAIYYKKHIYLAALIIPLILLRPNGLVLLLPLFLYFLEQNELLTKWKFNWRALFTKKKLFLTSAFITGPIAFAVYCWYQYRMTGYPFAFSIAQAGWYREFMFPILAFFRKGDLATQFNSIYTIIVIVYAFSIRKKLPLSLNTLIWISLILPLCSGSVTSMTRFISIIFPLFLILGSQIEKSRFKIPILMLILGLHFLSFTTWILNMVISN
jgi:Gpi18-like mannosyltransferase|tara:strand:- start:8191 stop:9264 length:1074 start_codon:yes stop_codon:yes gene_type:complete